MAVSSTSGSTSSSTTSIDVAGIVQQLMTVENRPLDAIKAKITEQNTAISDLGTIKSKVSTFQQALQAFQDPTTFSTASASSSDPQILSAIATNGALKGSYDVNVTSVATASKSTISGFSSLADSASINSVFTIKIAGTEYKTDGSTVNTPAIKSNPTVSDLKDWINALGKNATASIFQSDTGKYTLMVQSTQTGRSNAVTIDGILSTRAANLPTVSTLHQGSGTVTESASAVFNDIGAGETLTIGGLTFTAGTYGATASQIASAFGGLLSGTSASDANTKNSLGDAAGGTFTSGSLTGWSTSVASASNLNKLVFTSSTPNTNVDDLGLSLSGASVSLTKDTISAHDAIFTIDGGQPITRSTNSISDVLNGVTFNLLKASPANTSQTVTIAQGADVSSNAIDALIKAYNDVMTTYKDMTANSNNSSKPGTFANSPTVLSFINQIKDSFARGIQYGTNQKMSLSSIGIDLQLDGTAKFNSTNYSSASANGLLDALSMGVTVGYIDSTHNLDTFLTAQVSTAGALDDQIQAEKDSVSNLTKRQDDLQTHLTAVQNNLISQYSALNALLFQLNNTSTALTSALTALTNSQSKN